jgi:hypothetical protein
MDVWRVFLGVSFIGYELRIRIMRARTIGTENVFQIGVSPSYG